jgi:hypothetical protein
MKLARALVRRLIEPLELYDDSERPDFLKAETRPMTALLTEIHDLASPPGFEPGFQP